MKSVTLQNPYGEVSKSDYEPEFLGIRELGPVMIISGQSKSGKSVILNNILRHKLIHEYEPKNIHFFSETIRGDLTYKPIFRFIANSGGKVNIKETVDFDYINRIVKVQEKIAH